MIVQAYRPEQLIFVDEMSKDERTIQRLHGYGYVGHFIMYCD